MLLFCINQKYFEILFSLVSLFLTLYFGFTWEPPTAQNSATLATAAPVSVPATADPSPQSQQQQPENPFPLIKLPPLPDLDYPNHIIVSNITAFCESYLGQTSGAASVPTTNTSPRRLLNETLLSFA